MIYIKEWLLYVREYSVLKNEYVLNIYIVETEDIFHTIGEFYSRSLCSVKRIDYVEYSDKRMNYWIENGYNIIRFRNKYKVGEKTMTDQEYYEGVCPYTHRHCDDWHCADCDEGEDFEEE